jgi:hypothetical protein
MAGRSVIHMADVGTAWATWLNDQLDSLGWKPADLVRASGEKANGRPVIAADVVSGWLKGGALPRANFWQKLADIFEVDVRDIAAVVSGVQPTKRAKPKPRVISTREAILTDPKLTEASRAVLLAVYDTATSEDQGAHLIRRAGLGERTVRARAKAREDANTKPVKQPPRGRANEA